MRQDDYRSHLGIVLQDNFLFDGTIAENIRYGRSDATDAEMREAARRSSGSSEFSMNPTA